MKLAHCISARTFVLSKLNLESGFFFLSVVSPAYSIVLVANCMCFCNYFNKEERF